MKKSELMEALGLISERTVKTRMGKLTPSDTLDKMTDQLCDLVEKMIKNLQKSYDEIFNMDSTNRFLPTHLGKVDDLAIQFCKDVDHIYKVVNTSK
jgi:sugar-specific transcriptional regulator TrmB